MDVNSSELQKLHQQVSAIVQVKSFILAFHPIAIQVYLGDSWDGSHFISMDFFNLGNMGI